MEPRPGSLLGGCQRRDHHHEIERLLAAQDQVGVGARGHAAVDVVDAVDLVGSEQQWQRRGGGYCLFQGDVGGIVGTEGDAAALLQAVRHGHSGTVGPSVGVAPYLLLEPLGDSPGVERRR